MSTRASRLTLTVAAAVLAGISVSACQTIASKTNTMSDAKVLQEAAHAMNVQANELRLVHRDNDGTNTYAVVQTKDGTKSHCVINGGNLLSAGIVNSVHCTPINEPLDNRSPFAR